MTFAPASILAVRKLIQKHVPQLSNVELGIVGSKSTTSYHLGRSDLSSGAYSVTESSRDRNGLSEAASALDIGSFTITVKGRKWTLRDLSTWLVAECAAGAEGTADIREVIYSPDGKVVKRWDRLKIRSSGDDSHLTHTHVSWFRDSENRTKTSVFERWFRHIGAIEGDDVSLTSADIEKVWETDGIVAAPANSPTVGTNPYWAPKSFLTDTASHVRSIYALLRQVATKVNADPIDESAIVAGVLAGLPASAIADAIPAELAGQVVSQVLAKLPKATADELLARLAS